jgi:urease accessory protein
MATATTTGTRSSHSGTLLLRVERRGGRSVVTHAEGHEPYAARVVPGREGWARVVLVQTIAGPLAGDRVAIDVEVAAGAALELTANAATLAFPSDNLSPAPARHDVKLRVAEDARVAWLPQPLILAAGCDLAASVEVELARGAAAFTRELVVLGRHGEEPGRYRSRLRAEHDGKPLLHDEIRLPAGTPVDLDGARAYGSLALLGLDADPEEFRLAGPGSVLRALAPDAAGLRVGLATTEAAWLAQVGARASGGRHPRAPRAGAL